MSSIYGGSKTSLDPPEVAFGYGEQTFLRKRQFPVEAEADELYFSFVGKGTKTGSRLRIYQDNNPHRQTYSGSFPPLTIQKSLT